MAVTREYLAVFFLAELRGPVGGGAGADVIVAEAKKRLWGSGQQLRTVRVRSVRDNSGGGGRRAGGGQVAAMGAGDGQVVAMGAGMSLRNDPRMSRFDVQLEKLPSP